MQQYWTATNYVVVAREMLQDSIVPYRYDDNTIIGSLNMAMREVSHIRPDMFLDLKYQRPLRKGDIDDGKPGFYGLTDISVSGNPPVYDTTKGTMVPIPDKYIMAIGWYIVGWLQLLDVTDTQDQRAQAFLQKFQQHLMAVSAA